MPITTTSCFTILLFFHQLLQIAAAQSSNYDQLAANDGDLSPSVAVLFGILFCAFLLTALLSLYIHHCCSTPLLPHHHRFLIDNNNNSGIDKSVIETFPIILYSSKLGSVECAVCLSEFVDGVAIRMLPRCGHVFHPDCVGGWLASHTTCPVCRADLVPSKGEKIELESVEIEIVGRESSSTTVVTVKVVGERNDVVCGSGSDGGGGGDSVSRLGGEGLRMPRAVSFPLLGSLRCGFRSGGDGDGDGNGGELTAVLGKCLGNENRLPVNPV